LAAVWGSRFSTMDPPSRAPQRVGAMVAIALHVAAGSALLFYEPARSALFAAAPIMVDFIAPPRQEEPRIEPPVELPKPRPVRKIPRPVEAPPLVTAPAEAPSPIVVPVTQPIFNANYLENPPPRYPALSRRTGEQGRVILRVLVNPGGTADEVQVNASSGYARLDETARETVRRWKFVPAKRGAEAVGAWVLIPIHFRLEG
jgi:protein TonB